MSQGHSIGIHIALDATLEHKKNPGGGACLQTPLYGMFYHYSFAPPQLSNVLFCLPPPPPTTFRQPFLKKVAEVQQLTPLRFYQSFSNYNIYLESKEEGYILMELFADVT